MNRNPIVPYILIMVIGLGLIFFLSIKGVGDAKQLAKERGDVEEEMVEFEPEAFANKNCISCHGGNLEGGPAAPSLHGMTLSQDEIAEILIHGTDGGMPGNLVPAENVEELAAWLAELK